ncbi:MAG: hypothetical protein AB7Q00_15865 [Phycisphaerales bacterium]
MTFSENLRNFWFGLTLSSRVLIAASLMAFSVGLVAAVYKAVTVSFEVRKYEREANNAKRDAEAAVAAAVKIAEEKKKLEIKISALEERRNEKQLKVDQAMRDADDAVADWERTRRLERTDDPGTDQLCTELAELGYPCR